MSTTDSCNSGVLATPEKLPSQMLAVVGPSLVSSMFGASRPTVPVRSRQVRMSVAEFAGVGMTVRSHHREVGYGEQREVGRAGQLNRD